MEDVRPRIIHSADGSSIYLRVSPGFVTSHHAVANKEPPLKLEGLKAG